MYAVARFKSLLTRQIGEVIRFGCFGQLAAIKTNGCKQRLDINSQCCQKHDLFLKTASDSALTWPRLTANIENYGRSAPPKLPMVQL
jgi:hypothetical protein